MNKEEVSKQGNVPKGNVPKNSGTFIMNKEELSAEDRAAIAKMSQRINPWLHENTQKNLINY